MAKTNQKCLNHRKSSTVEKIAERRISSAFQEVSERRKSKAAQKIAEGRRRSSAFQNRSSRRKSSFVPTILPRNSLEEISERRASNSQKNISSLPGRRPTKTLGKHVYFAVVALGLVLAIGGGLGIGFLVYPSIFNSTFSSALGDIPVDTIDIQSDDSDEILTSLSTTGYETTTPVSVKNVNSRDCGRSALSSAEARRLSGYAGRKKRVVNGAIASITNFPWQVSLWVDGAHSCGGSILSSTWILTAAHCLQPNADPKNWTVHAGANTQLDMYDNESQKKAVTDLVLHARFSTQTFANDVALMRLESPLVMGKMVSTICLPTSDVEPGKLCLISGWGAKEEGGTVTNNLMNATVQIIDSFVCNGDEWLGGMVLESMMFCAGKESGEVDACQGDSGGPLSCQRDDGRFDLSGVVSWGIGCGTYRMPGVYVRMTQYRDWVFESIQAVELKYR